VIAGLLGALGGGVGGGMLGHNLTGGNPLATGIGSAAGAVLGGGVLGSREYLTRSANNEGLKDMLQRLRPGATLRDLRSDPIYEKDRDTGRSPYSAGNFLTSDDYTTPAPSAAYPVGLTPQMRAQLLQFLGSRSAQ
jgi:hypothetical protein